MSSSTPLLYGHYYHIFNRGNNRVNLFLEERNYEYFLNLYDKYIDPIARTLAFCLLRNHFHFFVQIRSFEEIQKTLRIPEGQIDKYSSLQFGHLFNAYTKAINKTYQRTGSLFEKPFKRLEVLSDAHFMNLVAYIHRNPQKHGMIDDFRAWPYSSYHEFQSTKLVRVQRDRILKWFNDLDHFNAYHFDTSRGERNIDYLILEDKETWKVSQTF
jgi:putative transposase